MTSIGQIERKTQNRIAKLFNEQLGYHYLGNWDERGGSNIEEGVLRKYLTETKKYSSELIEKVIFELSKAAGNQSESLYDINKAVYLMLRYGVKVRPEAGANTETVDVINWKQWNKNDFAIAEEVTVKGEHHKRPDIVLYINGIAIGVIELKRSTISISEGIRQNLDNQKGTFIRNFFATVQLVMAGNDIEGLKYGCIETKEKYYLGWKEESDIENPLDRGILQMCNKQRLVELLHDFVVYDRGIKKLCRPNQYFGVKAAQEHIRRREGGIIWHTQGSGKSLTMVWLTKWIKENVTNSRVLVITDREELDEQIEKVYTGVGETIVRTKSGKDLIDKLNTVNPWLLCSLIHKFGKKDEGNIDEYVEELERNLPADFKAKGDIYVFVDECHRTQSGKLHGAMKKILPNALFIGFTGTPLLKKDKESSMEVFGTYIHTYKFDEAVKDKVVLDLRYEARNVDQQITSQEGIDRWFNAKTRGLTNYALTELKKRWGTLQKVLSSRTRISRIMADILMDMEERERLQNGRGNAMLVAGSIYQACRYYELFQEAGFTKCAIITSYNPSISDIKGESVVEEPDTENVFKYDTYVKMLNGKTPEQFEMEVKRKFIEEPAQMKLLIVVDKLLTGFDAPPATYLYIDSSMQDHGLFQAICRVNRLDGDDKEYGYVVDYKDLFKRLEKAVSDYTSDAFDAFEKEDVEGLLADRLQKGKERLDECLESIKALIEPIGNAKDQLQCIRYFCGNPENPEDLKNTEQRRISLYKQTVALIRAFANIANEMEEAGYTIKQTEQIKEDMKFFENLRQEIKLASRDYIDLKQYEPAMRHLIDTYISATDSTVVSAFDDITLLQLIAEKGMDVAANSLPSGIRKNKNAMAETIENNIRRLIIDEMPTNPKYYEKMSVLLDELIRQRKEEAQEYKKYLAALAKLIKNVTKPEDSKDYPKAMNTPGKRALFDNLNRDANLALQVDAAIISVKKDDWRGNKQKEKEIRIAIGEYIEDEEEVNRVYEIVRAQTQDY
ncbi:restriction endonuclease subunit R [Niabella ginsenosidivorans]|uniref:Type I restriction enzyme endonuclease subunit n=1 Tax=Niabella ginsenosidivorans TaxID=1176587 RepID=A0A1A9I7Z3_9BACT|nr:type I restriction endonuclease subunit R [Niabella ginsenosidivorans]ANH83169.1 restriction endonuclease subunit R [Niabella ginsenosidivorans]